MIDSRNSEHNEYKKINSTETDYFILSEYDNQNFFFFLVHLCFRRLAEAAAVIGDSKVSLQLRYLQTLTNVAAEHNQTIVVPFPMEVARYYAQHWINELHI